MYNTLLEKMRKELEQQQQRTIDALPAVDWVLKDNSTPHRWEQYQSGAITRQQAEALAIVRIQHDTEKRYKTKALQLAQAEQETAPAVITVVVEWHKSRTWGHCPKATAQTPRHTGTGTASGLGYDKHSTAVAEALNGCPDVQKLLFDFMDAHPLTENNRNALGYGSGYGALPYFEGGCGMSTIYGIFAKLGYTATHTETATVDVHTFTKGGKQ